MFFLSFPLHFHPWIRTRQRDYLSNLKIGVKFGNCIQFYSNKVQKYTLILRTSLYNEALNFTEWDLHNKFRILTDFYNRETSEYPASNKTNEIHLPQKMYFPLARKEESGNDQKLLSCRFFLFFPLDIVWLSITTACKMSFANPITFTRVI